MHVLALASIIFAVSAFNGRPAFFGDTPIYYTQGEFLATTLGFPPLPMTATRRADPYSVVPGSLGFANRGAVAVAAARSPVYGLLLFLTERLGTLWLLVAVQALAASWSIYLFVRAAAPQAGPRIFYGCGAVLALTSSLPFFAAFAMPDIFAGVNILCVVLIVLFNERLTGFERAGVWLLLWFGVAAHMSNALTLLGMTAASALLLALAYRSAAGIALRCGLLLAAMGAALLTSHVCGQMYEHRTGLRQIAPPFLMARVLADGPGRAYLADACPKGAAPTLCRYAHRSFDNEEAFLWSRKPNEGVYALADYATQLQLKREELPFVLHAVAAQPLRQFGAMIQNWGLQLTLFTLIEPMHNPAEFLTQASWRNTSAWQIVPGNVECEHQPARCQPRIPLRALQVWQGLCAVLSLMIVAIALVSSDLKTAIAQSGAARSRSARSALTAGVLIGVGVLLNGAVCGALSGPYPRYEARLIWLLPLTAALLVQLLPWREALAIKRRSTPAQGRSALAEGSTADA